MMKRSFVLGAVLTCVFTGSAMAADMPTKSPVYRPEAFSWSGFYVGGVAGAGIVTPQFATSSALFSNFQGGDWAFTGGGTVGYNWQWASSVFGIEADFNWTNFDRSLLNPGGGTQFDAKWNWFSTMRARAGFALDRTLLYATAGVAIVDLDYQVFNPELGCNPSFSGNCAKLSKTEVGLALGAGVEYALASNWSFKTEYLYIRLPTRDVGVQSFNDDKFQYKTDAHFARIGLNYRFGGPGARY